MKAKFLIPLVVFLGLVVFLAIGLTRDPREVPSPLVGKAAPAFQVPELHDAAKTISTDDFKGQVWMFNVWASWCVACREEHPLLMQLARTTDIQLIGLDYKDKREDGQRFLQTRGDPYRRIAFDADGRVGINYGVYGVPETFIIDKKGVIRHKHIGPITPEALQNKILPLIQQLRSES
jgi:cytochrome c biogenesis protein CcmG/thiol:disulfide interchange protein DsbE